MRARNAQIYMPRLEQIVLHLRPRLTQEIKQNAQLESAFSKTVYGTDSLSLWEAVGGRIRQGSVSCRFHRPPLLSYLR